jgi:ABC-type transporter Mla subunit MlaD
MTKLELIQQIGDVLTNLDIVIGSLLPSDPRHRQLLDVRLLLDDRQRAVSRQAFVDNSEQFQRAAQELANINDDLRKTIRKIDELNSTIENVTRFLNSLTSLVTTLAAVA